MARNKNSGWSRKWSAFFSLIIILGGVAVSLGFAVRLRDALQRNAETRMVNSSTTLQGTVVDQLATYIDTVRSSAAGLTALHTPTKDGFTEITSAIAAQKLPAVSAVRFLVGAAPGELGPVESTWRPRGATGLTIKPVKDAQQHYFTVFSRGLNGTKAPAIGVDQVAAPAEVEVTRLVRLSRDVAISDAYVLLSDAGLAEDKQQLSFDVVAGVYAQDKSLTGYLALSIRGTEFLTSSLTAASGGLLDAELLTRSSSGTLAQVAQVSENRSQDVRRTQDFTSGQRQWVVRTSTSNQELLPTAGRTDMAVLLAGSVLAFMFGTLMYLQMSATARADEEIELEVAERLAALGITPPPPPADEDDEEDGEDAEDEPAAAAIEPNPSRKDRAQEKRNRKAARAAAADRPS